MRLNLRTSVVEDYFKSKSKRLSKILEKLEPVEYWVLDSDKDIAASVAQLAEVLEKAHEYQFLENSEDLIKVLAYLSCSKAYYFMTWLDDNFNKDISVDFMEKAVSGYNEMPEFSIHVERFDTINKINMIGSIFSEARLAKIIKILESVKEDVEEQQEYDIF